MELFFYFFIFYYFIIIFLPGADAPHVYTRAWTLCCFHSLSTQTFRKRVPLQWRNHFWQRFEESAGKRCSELGGKCRKAMLGVGRKVPESDARSWEESAGKRCSELGGKCRKAMLEVRRKMPESDARSVNPLCARTTFPRARLDPRPRTKYPGTGRLFPQDPAVHKTPALTTTREPVIESWLLLLPLPT